MAIRPFSIVGGRERLVEEVHVVPSSRVAVGLEAPELLALLREAAKPATSSDRRTSIGDRLVGAIFSPDPADEDTFDGDNGRAVALETVVERLFYGTLKNKPEALPTLYPVFALICGNRWDDELLNRNVDWSVMDGAETTVSEASEI